MFRSIIGLFNNRSDAQAAEQSINRAGVTGEQVTVVEQHTGSLSSNLVKAGIPEQDAQIYSDGVQQGGSLLVAQAVPEHNAEQIAGVIDRHRVVNISRRSPNYQQVSLDRFTSSTDAFTNVYEGDEIVIPIIEEELIIRKEERERGGVRVNVGVEEVPVNEQVTVRDETVQVQRRQVDRPVSDADMAALQGEAIEVRETDEEVVVDKQARVVEEMHIAKDVDERTEVIRDTVRRTVVDVQEVTGTDTSERAVGSDRIRGDDNRQG